MKKIGFLTLLMMATLLFTLAFTGGGSRTETSPGTGRRSSPSGASTGRHAGTASAH